MTWEGALGLVGALARPNDGLDVRGALDALWLAAHLPSSPETLGTTTRAGPVSEPKSRPEAAFEDEPTEVVSSSEGPSSSSQPIDEERPPPQDVPGSDPALPGLGLWDDEGSDLTSGRPVEVPSPVAWPGSGALARALAGLGHRAPLGRRRALDVEATVQKTAQHMGTWSPVEVPRRARPFALVLVVAPGPLACVWAPAVDDLARRVRSRPAFRSVAVVRAKEGLRPTLPDVGPGRVVVLATDATEPAWTESGSEANPNGWLRDWSQDGPVAVLPLLPPERWPETALAWEVVRVHRKALTDQDRRVARLPVLAPGPRSFRDWSRFLRGAGTTTAFVWDAETRPCRPTLGPAKATDAGPELQARLKTFDVVATPNVQALAQRLAALPLSPPVMRWALQAMGTDAQLSDLMEVLVSGLIAPRDRKAHQDDDDARFDFGPGTAERLRARMKEIDVFRVLQGLWDRIAQAPPGQSHFLAFLYDPSVQVLGRLPMGARRFAIATSRHFEHLRLPQHALTIERESAFWSPKSMALLDRVGRAPDGVPALDAGPWPRANALRYVDQRPELSSEPVIEALVKRLSRIGLLLQHDERLRVAPDCAHRVAPPVKELDGPAGMRFLWMPPGTFLMGSPPDDDMAFEDERPQHEVKLDGFYLAVTPVTQRQYQDAMGDNPSHFKGEKDSPDRPVENVSWRDVVRFCNRLSEREGLPPFYEIGPGDEAKARSLGGPGHRLPTEAEWEYACRAGTTTRYPFGHGPEGLEDHAWLDKNSKGQTRPVATKLANPWGLHDMLGNVWERCWSDPQAYPTKANESNFVNITIPRVLRGGSWVNGARGVRPAYRDFGDRWARDGFGLRSARTLP